MFKITNTGIVKIFITKDIESHWETVEIYSIGKLFLKPEAFDIIRYSSSSIFFIL